MESSGDVNRRIARISAHINPPTVIQVAYFEFFVLWDFLELYLLTFDPFCELKLSSFCYLVFN